LEHRSVFSISEHHAAAWLTPVVSVEVLVLAVNGWRCPMTSMAGRFTDERRENFDIYLPVWLATHNQLIFGTFYVAGFFSPSCRGCGCKGIRAPNMTR
jgi:hypothetical protein